MDNVKNVLEDRLKPHGDFTDVAKVTMDLLDAIKSSPNYDTFSDVQKIGLYMVLHKVARICCGDPNLKDHYTDIMGYTRLILDRI